MATRMLKIGKQPATHPKFAGRIQIVAKPQARISAKAPARKPAAAPSTGVIIWGGIEDM